MPEKPWKERQPDAPKCSTTPLDSLTPKPSDTVNLASRYEIAFPIGFIVGAGCCMITNFVSARPYYSSMHRILGAGLVSGLLFRWFDNIRRERHAERDVLMREYVLLHPEDFPPYDRRQYKDILLPWTPRR